MTNLEQIHKSNNLVDLIGITPNAEEIIVYCARVSNPNNQLNMDSAPKLIKYLIANKHWSPFELAHITMQIKTSRGIAPQILRHRSFSFQEFSLRYSAVTDNVIYPARRQDQKNRQNSIDDMDQKDKNWFDSAQDRIWQEAKAAYDEALSRGIAKEQARFLLPMSAATTMYMSGSVRSWIHYIELRTENGTQKEHMDIAEACKKIFAKELPLIAAALNWV
jgi:thymidylate synthase (FAD)